MPHVFGHKSLIKALLNDAVWHSTGFAILQMDEYNGESVQVEFVWHKAPEYPGLHIHK